MPIYLYQCEKCGGKMELRQGMHEGIPLCCGAAMQKMPTSPAIIRVVGTGGARTYNKGYKKGYSKDYLRSIGKA